VFPPGPGSAQPPVARVMAAARELSFTPNPIARGLTTGRTSTVGLIIADSMSHRFAVPVMLGAEAALGEIELSMITCDAGVTRPAAWSWRGCSPPARWTVC
jgi:DNA-binding LacI/PurR family transcriptional regulator